LCPLRQLSGGERNRLMLARLFAQASNVLVFDEPTNDLDTETLELLEEILLAYKGTVLVVSHDREFLNNVVAATLVFEGKGIVKEYIGGYDDWQAAVTAALPAKKTGPAAAVKRPASKLSPQEKKKLSFKEKQELESLPLLIERLEQEHKELGLQMADPAWFRKPGFITLSKERLARIDTDLSAAYRRWEDLSERPQ
jgi:ATP-binding cassette subfamily F protein uup